MNLKKTLTNFITLNTSEILKQSMKILTLYTSLTFFLFIVLNLFTVWIYVSLSSNTEKILFSSLKIDKG